MRSAHPLAVLSFPLLLFACGQPEGPVNEHDPYAGGMTFPWTYTAPSGTLTGQSLTSGENTLYYEPILAARNSWGPIEVDRSNGEQAAGDGRPLTLNGQTYARGYGTHAGSELRFSLKGTGGAQCTRFTAAIGVDDEVGSRGSVVFQVYLDGVKAYDSGVMTGASATKMMDLPLQGQQELRLVVTDAGNGISYDHADWASPKVFCQAGTSAPTVTLDRNELGIYHLHTGTLRATFTGYGAGQVELQLVPDQPDHPEDPERERPYPLVLNTPVLSLSGKATETHDIVIGAPEKYEGFYTFVPGFHLDIRQNGNVVQRLPVSLTELPINFTATIGTSEIRGQVGEIKTYTLTVTADPPLNDVQDLSIVSQPVANDLLRVVGPTRGTGQRMQAEVEVQLPNEPGINGFSSGVAIGNITTGYRDRMYNNSPSMGLKMTVSP